MLSHIDAEGLPTMVDVGDKEITPRNARACAEVHFPPEVFAALEKQALRTAKGSIIDTAIIAGTMAVKRTHELIPFCHPLAVESIKFETKTAENRLILYCRVRCRGRTGVEMEALTGAGVAALTVYDMCKALSHDIRIEGLRLLEKTGGKSDFGEDKA